MGYSPDDEDVIESIGLDQAMLLQFTKVCMEILMWVGVPMICVIGPMNCAFGGQPAWAIGDYLSSLSFGNVENGSWLYWVHAFVIWYVVIIVQRKVYAAMGHFVELRRNWLYGMADLRAKTILVEGIPEDFRSDAKLKEFFAGVFDPKSIQSAYMTKDTAVLTKAIARLDAAQHSLDEANHLWEKACEAGEKKQDPEKRPKFFGGGDKIEHYEKEIK